MSIRILATAVLRYKKHFWPKSIPLLISFLLRQIRLIMLHVWSQHLLKTWTRQCLHFSFDNSISLSQSRFVSIQDASDTLWMLCNECVSKQIYSWKVQEEKKDVSVQVEDLACVLKKSQNRKKFICKNAYTFLCVHIKMHIFQDQSQEAFDAFVHLWLVHLYFSFLRVKSLLFDVIGTWRNQLHQKTYSCIENFLDDSIDEMTNAGISHLSNLTMKRFESFFGRYVHTFFPGK